MERLVRESIAAHSMRFEHPLAPAYGSAAGVRVGAAFIVVALVFPVAARLASGGALAKDPALILAYVLAWLAAFALLQRFFVRTAFGDVGVRAPAEWGLREKLYLAQVVPVAIVAFAFIFRGHLAGLVARHGIAGFLLYSLAGGLVWGIAQELVYRGWLQTELTRRLGAAAGLIAANLVFTFGPLHFNHIGGPGGPHWAVLAAIFAIGLVFGFLYMRSGNAWLPAILHGLWPPNMT
jgi:CAAX protease family protein